MFLALGVTPCSAQGNSTDGAGDQNLGQLHARPVPCMLYCLCGAKSEGKKDQTSRAFCSWFILSVSDTKWPVNFSPFSFLVLSTYNMSSPHMTDQAWGPPSLKITQLLAILEAAIETGIWDNWGGPSGSRGWGAVRRGDWARSSLGGRCLSSCQGNGSQRNLRAG